MADGEQVEIGQIVEDCGGCGFYCESCHFFFFKQKTAYELLRSLVGSEMCIRDRKDSSSLIRTIFKMIWCAVVLAIAAIAFGIKKAYLSLIHI